MIQYNWVKGMAVYDTIDKWEDFLEQLDFLRRYVSMPPLGAAKEALLREKSNQRLADASAGRSLFKVWKSMLKNQYVMEGRTDITLEQYAYEQLCKKVQEEKGLTMGR